MVDEHHSSRLSGEMIDFDAAVELARTRPAIRLIAIDGLPVAGKSTLAERMAEALQADCTYLDDFVAPEVDWPLPRRPAFPFQYIRYAEFLDSVTSLGRTGCCAYRPYDWSTGAIEADQRVLRLDRPVIIEGVSSLHPDLAPLYDLRIWVESDAATVLEASLKRGVGAWEREWRDLFLPSVELYLRTAPRDRADVVVAGRGAR
jgi:uridine kinase